VTPPGRRGRSGGGALARALGGLRRGRVPEGGEVQRRGVPDGAAAPGEPRVVLYGRQGCHLCADAREVVRDVAARTGAGVREVDVDAPGSGEEPGGRPGALAARYGELVPVVLVDGVQHAVYHVDPARLEAVLLRPSR